MLRFLHVSLTAVLCIVLANQVQAQMTYTISASTTWTTLVNNPTCNTCTFNIASAATFTVDQNVSNCHACTFNGNVAMTASMTCQSCAFSNGTLSSQVATLTLQSGTTSFSGVTLNFTGTPLVSASILANAPVSISNSTFTFYNQSNFNNNSGLLSITTSVLNFYDTSYLYATAGPVNLQSSSQIVVGNNVNSAAYLKMNTNSPLQIYDAKSFVSITNNNNFYYDFSPYNAIIGSMTTSYTTQTNTLNCGTTGPNACLAPFVYGCASLTSTGLTACTTTLPLTNLNFSGAPGPGKTVLLSWSTGQEINVSHFVVQRSPDGSNWSAIANVAAKGNTTLTTDYSFADDAPAANVDYYRLQAVDQDGQITYSTVIVVSLDGPPGGIGIYPNPVNTGQSFYLTVPSTNPVMVRIVNLAGQLLSLTSLNGQTLYQVPVPSNVPHNSLVIVQVTDNGSTRAIRLFCR